MRVILRINLPSTPEGDEQLRELTKTWLHTDGDVVIVTPDAQVVTRLTYVKTEG